MVKEITKYYTYFLDYMSDKYAGFYKSLLSSPCKEVNILATGKGGDFLYKLILAPTVT